MSQIAYQTLSPVRRLKKKNITVTYNKKKNKKRLLHFELQIILFFDVIIDIVFQKLIFLCLAVFEMSRPSTSFLVECRLTDFWISIWLFSFVQNCAYGCKYCQCETSFLTGCLAN